MKRSLAVLAATALQFSISAAYAQQQAPSVVQDASPAVIQERSQMNAGSNREGTVGNQDAARAAHPITQGGTTGGTVNPGVNGDHKQHGYNGG